MFSETPFSIFFLSINLNLNFAVCCHCKRDENKTFTSVESADFLKKFHLFDIMIWNNEQAEKHKACHFFYR